MPYALYFEEVRISEFFPTKTDAWEFAHQSGFVTVVPARDEDPPRKVLSLRHSIRHQPETATDFPSNPGTTAPPTHASA